MAFFVAMVVKMGRLLIFLMCLAGAASAQEILPADYAALGRDLNQLADFETLPQHREPGFRLDRLYRHRGMWLGERLAGQSVSGDGAHDALQGRRYAPLAVLPGAPGQNQSIAFHRGFGSNALFPLGKIGFPDLEARGEGAVAILFDQDQWAVAFKVHSGYARPLGGAAKTGALIVSFYDRRGRLIARTSRKLAIGINAFGFRRDGRRADIAAITVENTDPGGIAMDDLIYELRPRIG